MYFSVRKKINCVKFAYRIELKIIPLESLMILAIKIYFI